MTWETVIGLEVHVQLCTKTKIFSGAPAAYGATPNTQACAIDLAMPGVLPMLNEAAVRMALKFGLAINAEFNSPSLFVRKNYFYPDLPKGYQISQHEKPIVGKGHLDIVLEDGSQKSITITRAHLEEDAGKSLHDSFDINRATTMPKTAGSTVTQAENFWDVTAIDLNRAGVALLEIVSEPELCNAKEAVTYLKTLYALVTCLDICDGNLQEGSLRCDANVSVRRHGATEFGTRAEIKNLNSFRFVEHAIDYEVQRQIALLETGTRVEQETRLYDADKNETRTLRRKENANDYRYFNEPDLLPVFIDPAVLEEIRASLPELPWQTQARFMQHFELSRYDANLLVSNRDLSRYFEAVVAHTRAPAKQVVNWISGELLGALNRLSLTIADAPISAVQLAGLLDRIHDNTISGKIAKLVFEAILNGATDADAVIAEQGLTQVTDRFTIEKIIDVIMLEHAAHVTDFRNGKEKLFGFFVGAVMQATHGKANPQQVNTLLTQKLRG